MKTNLTKLITLCLMLCMSYGAFAQDQTKSVGESYTYTVIADSGSGTNTYTWNISGLEDTDWEVIGGALNTASVKILWLKPNDYTVSFTQEQEHATGIVCTTTQSGTVKVGNTFDATIADATSVCGGTTGNTNFTFLVSKTGGNANWSFHYKTDGLGTAEVEGDENVIGADSFSLVIPVANVTDGTDKAFNVVLTLIKDSAGNEDTDNSNDETATVNLYGVPNTGGINWL
jgi:hypothetical protein